MATGLDNPRGLAFGPEGAIYVAEAVRGGEGPCVAGPEGPVCYGATGVVTRIWDGMQERVATGLPSIANPENGGVAIGPVDFSLFGRGGAYVVVGLGNDPAVRDELGPDGAGFGQLVQLSAGGAWRNIADVSAYEAGHDPDGGAVDSNPYAVFAQAGQRVVADAGANALLAVAANGSITTLAVSPDRLVDAPPFLELPPGTQIPMQAVPNSVIQGLDGAYDVGKLTGFPFPVGGARVYRLAPGGSPEIYLEGFTNIIDLGFGPDGSLYVLEIAANGLLAGFGFGDWTGALIRVAPDGSRITIASDGLYAPGGVAIGPDGALYVTNNSIRAGAGEVLRIEPENSGGGGPSPHLASCLIAGALSSARAAQEQ